MTAECKVKSAKRLLCVEYPGVVVNAGAMLTTLNGIAAIEHTYNNPNDRLELKFRPEDQYSHPTYADRVSTNSLFIKFIRRKKKDGRVEFEAKLMGVVDTCYRFKSMADFQYLPMTRGKLTDGSVGYMSIVDKLIPKEPFNVETSDVSDRRFEASAPLLILPTLFSRFDSPMEYYFRNDSKHRDSNFRKELEKQEQLSIIGRTRKSRSILATLLNWSERTPQEPTPQVVQSLNDISTNDQLYEKLVKCFEERPVWSRNALVGRLTCERADIKFMLPKIAYYFVNGPFRCMWIRFGYDPRVQKDSKIYQTLDFRVKQVYAKNMSSDKIKAKRSIYQYQLPLKKRDSANVKTKQSTISSDSFIASSSRSKPEENEETQSKAQKLIASYVFKEGLMPAYRQLFYQLCDIEVEEVQKIIHSNDGREPEVCDERDGWCARGTIDKIRVIMSAIIDSMLANASTSEPMDVEESVVNDEEMEDNDEVNNDDEFLEYYP